MIRSAWQVGRGVRWSRHGMGMARYSSGTQSRAGVGSFSEAINIKTKEPKTKEPKTKEPKTKEPKTEEPKTKEPKTKEPKTTPPADSGAPKEKAPVTPGAAPSPPPSAPDGPAKKPTKKKKKRKMEKLIFEEPYSEEPLPEARSYFADSSAVDCLSVYTMAPQRKAIVRWMEEVGRDGRLYMTESTHDHSDYIPPYIKVIPSGLDKEVRLKMRKEMQELMEVKGDTAERVMVPCIDSWIEASWAQRDIGPGENRLISISLLYVSMFIKESKTNVARLQEIATKYGFDSLIPIEIAMEKFPLPCNEDMPDV
eukprot:TRINITY_DN220_c0_g1_i1.p1 TRINITY_DN220_c0_g1~~TRINITY_DN220_c0_g1_i1.p1  ORF type:complete len:310 (-),score=57.35 TRINITY_DN220_c0_g1_i1:92-1021(-)